MNGLATAGFGEQTAIMSGMINGMVPGDTDPSIDHSGFG